MVAQYWHFWKNTPPLPTDFVSLNPRKIPGPPYNYPHLPMIIDTQAKSSFARNLRVIAFLLHSASRVVGEPLNIVRYAPDMSFDLDFGPNL